MSGRERNTRKHDCSYSKIIALRQTPFIPPRATGREAENETAGRGKRSLVAVVADGSTAQDTTQHLQVSLLRETGQLESVCPLWELSERFCENVR